MSVSTDDDKDTGKKSAAAAAAAAADAADPAAESESETAETESAETAGEPVDDDSDPAEPVTARGRRRRLLTTLVAAALVTLLAVAGFLGWQLWQEREVTRASEQAQQAAVEYAQVLTSIDSAKVDENFDAVLDGATGEFKDMYSQSSTELRQLLIDNKASAHGVVLESAVQSASKDKVVVLLFVDQSVSNTNVPDPRIDRSRIKMTMEDVDGRWRASKVELP
ncbi:DUF3329 domain-containing protein [Mycolicibacterium gilvum]|uniref:Membrane protein n=1 Tax=Mycolicibacterium gilvum TaxID=1804 RepID=A0A378SH17_9MYCO|nr:DUF3329 domain-containing protein [Mycolicibacterium gilvum]MCV7056252.1 DUF3329 domain-containing protein [Mycolicibacterium gilvum]STZ41675.1 membrane protein [Mycolicibacterium gilvum]